MTTLVPATIYVIPGEPVYTLAELDLVPPDYGPKHRYQLLFVNRDGRIAEYREDLGLASAFSSRQFRVLTFWEHSVAECRDIADEQRLGQDYWEKRLEEIQAESTLIEDFYAAHEEARKQIANQSIFGPMFTRQRNLI